MIRRIAWWQTAKEDDGKKWKSVLFNLVIARRVALRFSCTFVQILWVGFEIKNGLVAE